MAVAKEYRSCRDWGEAVKETEVEDSPIVREWALEIVAGALQILRDEMAQSGKSEQFEVLKGSLTGQEGGSRAEIAARLNMTEGAVKVVIHRLRHRYRNLLRATIAETVSNESDLEDEMRYLVEILRKR